MKLILILCVALSASFATAKNLPVLSEAELANFQNDTNFKVTIKNENYVSGKAIISVGACTSKVDAYGNASASYAETSCNELAQQKIVWVKKKGFFGKRTKYQLEDSQEVTGYKLATKSLSAGSNFNGLMHAIQGTMPTLFEDIYAESSVLRQCKRIESAFTTPNYTDAQAEMIANCLGIN